MNIFQVLQGVDNPSAGPTYSVGFLSHYLSKLGHEVTVVAFGSKPTGWPYQSSLKIFGGFPSRVGLVPMEAIRFAKTEMVGQPGILHGHGIWRVANLFPWLVKHTTPTKIVWSPRGMLSPWSWNHRATRKRPFWYALQRPALNRVHCFHATGESEVDDIRRLGFSQPVALIPNGVEIPVISNVQERKKTILYLSRIHEKKGLHLLIPAWADVAPEFPDWDILIAGGIDSPYGHRMVELAKRIGAPRLKFVGEVLGDDKKRLLQSVRLFVLPTFSENFGIAIAEALAHAVPVITTVETPWLDLSQRECGWCIHANEKDLKATLQEAMSLSGEKFTEMGKAGRAWMSQSYSWESVAQKFESFYQWVLDRGEKPPFVYS